MESKSMKIPLGIMYRGTNYLSKKMHVKVITIF